MSILIRSMSILYVSQDLEGIVNLSQCPADMVDENQQRLLPPSRALLRPQCLYRIGAGGPPSGQVAGQEGGAGENDGNGDEGDGVGGTHAV